MSEVVVIRVPKSLKERMKRVNINWSREIRKYIEDVVRRYELLTVIDEIGEKASARRVKTDSTELIREFRESR